MNESTQEDTYQLTLRIAEQLVMPIQPNKILRAAL